MFRFIPSLFSKSDLEKYCKMYTPSIMNVPFKQANPKIKVKSSFYSTTDDQSTTLKTSEDIKNGDTLILFMASNSKNILPPGFKEILNASDYKNDLSLTCGYKVWNTGNPLEFTCTLESKSFVNLITLEGTRFIVDAKGRINSSSSLTNEIVAPRAYTSHDGVMLTAYAYDEPKGICIRDQQVLTSVECCGRGLAVGISSTEGGLSKRVRALANDMTCGGGDDIAFCISII